MKPHGLPKHHLLRSKREFDLVYKKGKRRHHKNFSLIFTDNGLEYNRLGISIQKKTGNAVKRNRIKRITREVFRLNRDDFPRNADVVIAIRPGFSLNSPEEIKKAVNSVCP